jgi:RNA polymerase sigma-70 factor (ECF subfamily)
MDADDFRSLYRAHHGRVCAYLAHRTDAGTVEDLAAEVFLVAWRRQHETPAHVLPWLLNIAGKCLANQRRGNGRRLALAERVALAAGEAATTEQALVQEAQRRAIVAALGAVDDEQRELLILRHWDGLAPRDIARVLELSPVAARARLHRATRRLQRELRARLEAEGVPSALDLNGAPHAT